MCHQLILSIGHQPLTLIIGNSDTDTDTVIKHYDNNASVTIQYMLLDGNIWPLATAFVKLH